MPAPANTYTVGAEVICVRADSAYAGQIGTIVRSRASSSGTLFHTVLWRDGATPAYRDDSIRPAPIPASRYLSGTEGTTRTFTVPAGTRNYRSV